MKIDYNDMDKGIIPLIELLNEKGFITNGCCSGLYKDHNEEEDWGFDRGYITFSSSLSPVDKKQLKELSIKCCLKFIEEYNIPIYRFKSNRNDYVLFEKFISSYRIQNFIPIVNLESSDGNNITNIPAEILSEEMTDIVISDRWKRLYDSIDI